MSFALFRAGKTLLACATFALATAASAQSWPSRPVEWVVPYPAGGGTDVVARTLGQAMSATLGQPLVIVNKPGAATNIGADYVARAKPDGYTLLSADTATLAANPFLYAKLSYNVEKDFAPVGLTVRFPMILVVNPQVPARNLEEFRAWLKTAGEKANYATPGAGSPHHLATELFADQIESRMTHVPYRGAAPAVQDVVAGQVPFMFVDTASGQQFIASGKLRPIGIASPRRVKNFESIPTLAEQGLKGFEAYAWQGLVMPAGTPPEVIAKTNAALLKALDATEVKARLQVLGLEATPSSPAQMAEYAAKERAKWGPVIRSSGIKVD
ncbi:Bug family tripartite tricarboxylate transporter substrate binding protein [Ramlibacter rhizophilus]|uniref:Tripartite tricarboxylate transporter substrate binding protein n=1 Tax=Ramlibacter rhizophilus TaxID=1781167 RepID=A0A4Z0BDA7_9BURK|nr:tripartite tricarboxylate transporter substrate binding protein [Ramlibacter rhizophilus]TFY97295.1 tripartite tricarboxylate transporter substrate binding protein [Ramlibacter rhizophilus]